MTTGGVSVIAVIFVALLIAQKRMIPGLMMMIAFALFVLYMTGLVETGIQLFGPGTISNNCQRYVQHSKVTGLSVDTLAWLSQNDLCECLPKQIPAMRDRADFVRRGLTGCAIVGNEWYTLFVFWFVGAMLGPWMLIMAMQVATGGFEKR